MEILRQLQNDIVGKKVEIPLTAAKRQKNSILITNAK